MITNPALFIGQRVAGGTTAQILSTDANINLAQISSLGVTLGGTGGTTFTAGSIIFAGTGGALSQKVGQLYWDNTNNRQGIGTTSPAGNLEIMNTNAGDIGFIVQAASGATADMVQILNSSNLKRMSIGSDQFIRFWDGQTDTLGPGAAIPISINGIVDMADSAASLFLITCGTTIVVSAAPFLGVSPFFFRFASTLNTTAAASTFSGLNLYMNLMTHVANGTTCTYGIFGGAGSFTDKPTFNTLNSGLWINTSTYEGFRSNFAIGTGGTFAQRTAFHVMNATGAGGVGTQIGLDVDTLTKGITNVAIRTAASGEIWFGNKLTVYNNIGTVSNGVPSELATVDLTTQAAAISATTIYTPAATGLFRISIYLQVTQAATTSSILGGATGVVITYNDGDGNVAQSNTAALATTAGAIAVTAAGNSTTTNLEGSMIIYARTAVAIKYAIGYTSVGATPMQYAAHLKVEAL